MIKIKCFGISKEIVASEYALIEKESISVAQLRNDLESKYTALQKINSYMIAVNQEYAADDLIIKQSDEVAIIPPVSGG